MKKISGYLSPRSDCGYMGTYKCKECGKEKMLVNADFEMSMDARGEL